jgi:hypothetical protein
LFEPEVLVVRLRVDFRCRVDGRETNDMDAPEQYTATMSYLTIEKNNLLFRRCHEYISKLPDSYRTLHSYRDFG